MLPALLSRFDLIFILLDRADSQRDDALSAKLVSRHESTARRRLRPSQQASTQSTQSTLSDTRETLGYPDRVHLSERLKLNPTEQSIAASGKMKRRLVPPSLMQRFLRFCQSRPVPRFTDEAKRVLQQFYAQLRAQSDGTPVTSRQFQSLIRLSEARARIELSDVVEGRHVLDVIDLSQQALPVVRESNTKQQKKKRLSRKAQLAYLHELILARASQAPERLVTRRIAYDVVDRCKQEGHFEKMDRFAVLEYMCDQSYLLRQGQGQFKVLSV
ncbi:MAG: hypothetical protein MHM6MM_005385 [Cercozoa sp. M6MM]